jgi:unsaturated rhamnogalacturonyl hydrolase
MKITFSLVLAFLFAASPGRLQEVPVSRQVAGMILARYPDGRGSVWNYDEGTVLDGIDAVYRATEDEKYLRYIQRCVDRFVGEDGVIKTYKPEEESLDSVLMGRHLLLLYAKTGRQKYFAAATSLYNQLQHQPRTPEGGFWHKKRYPQQMWLDGLYMAEPFYAEYAARFNHPAGFDDIGRQFALLEQHARDARTGLLYHAWDSSKQQRWADKATGASPCFWSRAMGWYAMAIVDTLDFIPADHAAHAQLIAMLNRFAKAIVAHQNADGVWNQVTDRPATAGNYQESSGSAMFVYALAKGVRMGWLPASCRPAAQNGYQGVLARFVRQDEDGMIQLTGTADAVGLGGEPDYRDGSYAYYTGVRQLNNDARGLGALMLAASEMEMQSDRSRNHDPSAVPN